MTKPPEELTKDWKEGKLESLNNLIEFIKSTDNHQALSDNYLKENNCATRNEYNPAQEWGYGIVWVIADYVLPYLKQIKAMQDQIADASKKVEELELNNKILEKCQEEDFGVSYLVTVKTQRENDMFRDRLKECKKEFSDISTMACYPETHLTHPANFDELFNKCEGILTRIDAALNETQANPAADIKIQESEE